MRAARALVILDQGDGTYVTIKYPYVQEVDWTCHGDGRMDVSIRGYAEATVSATVDATMPEEQRALAQTKGLPLR